MEPSVIVRSEEQKLNLLESLVAKAKERQILDRQKATECASKVLEHDSLENEQTRPEVQDTPVAEAKGKKNTVEPDNNQPTTSSKQQYVTNKRKLSTGKDAAHFDQKTRPVLKNSASKSSSKPPRKQPKAELRKNEKVPASEAPDEQTENNIDSEKTNAVPTTGKYTVLGGHEVQAKPIEPIVPDWFRSGAPVSREIARDSVHVSSIDWLDGWMKDSLTVNGFSQLFPVQCKVIHQLLSDLKSSFALHPPDICVSAPTGSGKTLAYVLPILRLIRSQMVPSVRALVVVPVQELVLQVEDVFRKFAEGTPLKVVGLSVNRELAEEQELLVKRCEFRGLVPIANVLVATPGRLVDQMRAIDRLAMETKVNFHWLGRLRFLVIDEADRLMNNVKLDWLEEVEKAVYFSGLWDGKSLNENNTVVNKPPCYSYFGSDHCRYSPGSACSARLEKNPIPLQKILLSATLSHDPERLQQLNLFQPKLFSVTQANSPDTIMNGDVMDQDVGMEDSGVRDGEVSGKKIKAIKGSDGTTMITPSELSEKYIVCKSTHKPLVASLLLRDNPTLKRVLCFCNSNENAQRLTQLLTLLSVDSVKEYSSCVHKNILKRTFKNFVAGNTRILVCSDRMARGLDVEQVDAVISYDVPHLARTYVHRVGRTARAGRSGQALTLLGEDELIKFQKLMVSVGHWSALSALEQTFDLKESMDRYKTALEKLKDVLKLKRKKKKPS